LDGNVDEVFMLLFIDAV